MKTCTLDGCDRPLKAKLLCNSHYRKLTLYGDPFGGLSAYTRQTTLAERFFEGVSKSDGDDGCWVWTQGREARGYGAFKFQGRHYKAHRVSYELHNKVELDPSIKVRHGCDNPPCVNPKHLSTGTDADNTDDMLRRGRNVTKLTAEKVRAIRAAHRVGESTASLAAKYGVTQVNIQYVVKRKTWKHV